MSKFKVGDRVAMNTLPKNYYVAVEVLGKEGTIVKHHRFDDAVGSIYLVDYHTLGYEQYIPESALELVVVKKPRKVSSNSKSQINRILQYLLTGNSLTPVKAITLFGAYRLAARIYELRAAGHKIKAVNKTDLNGRVYAEYTLRKAGRVGA